MIFSYLWVETSEALFSSQVAEVGMLIPPSNGPHDFFTLWGSPVHVHFQQQIYPTINNNMHHYQLYPLYPLYPRFYALQNLINTQSMLTIVNPIHLYQPVNLYQPR